MNRKLMSLALVAGIVLACAGFGGCASTTGSSADSFDQHQYIAFACESAATAADSIAVATENGRLTAEQAQHALAVYRGTVPFCQPAPLAQLSDVDYAKLLAASVELGALVENSR